MLDQMLEDGEITEEQHTELKANYQGKLDTIEINLNEAGLPKPVVPKMKFASPKRNKPPRNVIKVKTAVMGSKTK
jgi:hypothetical protein